MNYYYHGTGNDYDGLRIMLEIIKSGGIKSKNKQNAKYQTLENGDDYISVCRWNEKEDFDNYCVDSAFWGWIFNMPCFIISDDIDAIPTVQTRYAHMIDHNMARVSKFRDEYHVKDEIPLDKVVGIALPFRKIPKSKASVNIIQELLMYAKKNNWVVYNSDVDLLKNVLAKKDLFEISQKK